MPNCTLQALKNIFRATPFPEVARIFAIARTDARRLSSKHSNVRRLANYVAVHRFQ
jgi:hypothetical protein